MTARWEAPNARARGLGTHLLSDEAMSALATAPDLAAMVALLEAAGIVIPEEGRLTPLAIELGIRRAAADELQRLARWFGDRSAAPGLIFADEDRRSLRAMIRGAAAGASAEARLVGLIPTPNLPERVLAELARQPRVIGRGRAAGGLGSPPGLRPPVGSQRHCHRAGRAAPRTRSGSVVHGAGASGGKPWRPHAPPLCRAVDRSRQCPDRAAARGVGHRAPG